jgi:hypothetical protein
VLKVQFIDAGDDLLLAPLLRRPVATSAATHDAVQHRQEDGPLDRERELAATQRISQHRGHPELVPQPPEDKGRAEAGSGEHFGLAATVIGQHCCVAHELA